MPRRSAFPALFVAAVVAAAALFPPASAGSEPVTLPDGSVLERWTLPNGIRVVTRSIPDTRAIAVTVGYPFGTDDDPATCRGLAQLLGHLAFLAPAGEVPGRRPEELDIQRPAGWAYPVLRQATFLSEGATSKQLPGVLAHLARRMRGVDVDAALLRAEVKNVKQELRAQLDAAGQTPAGTLALEAALGHSNEQIARLASGRDLDALKPAEVTDWMRRAHAPNSAVVSLVGDLRGLEVRKLVDGLFGSIPAGPAQATRAPVSLRSGERTYERKGAPVAAVGLLAPSLDDSMHSAFCLGVAMLGMVVEKSVEGNPDAKDWRGFDFGLFDEPGFARVYPFLQPGFHTPENAGKAIEVLSGPLLDSPLALSWLSVARDRITHMVGGRVTPRIARMMRDNPRTLIGVSRAQANAELSRGFEFWDRYRQRLERTGVEDIRAILGRLQDPTLQMRAVVVPAGAGAATAPKQP